ncbi:hypothetical protein Tco_0097651 [Tanacetum coccineum]
MSLRGFTDNEYEPSDGCVTLISRLDSCVILLALEGKNKFGFIDDTCRRSNTDEKQFDALIELPRCTCHAAKDFRKHNQLMKLMQFLIGLDDSYMQIRSYILSRATLPDVKSAYATIFGEESYMVKSFGSNSGNNSGTSQRSQTFAFSANVHNKGNFHRSQTSANFLRPPTMTRPNENRNRRTVGVLLWSMKTVVSILIPLIDILK